MAEVIPFKERVLDILGERNISRPKFCFDTEIDRANFFYRKQSHHNRCRYIYMAIAYYFDMDVEELIHGTDAELDWYGDCGI